MCSESLFKLFSKNFVLCKGFGPFNRGWEQFQTLLMGQENISYQRNTESEALGPPEIHNTEKVPSTPPLALWPQPGPREGPSPHHCGPHG